MKTLFNPLKEDSVFVGKIIFHNLRKNEIGALLSAITMHGTSGLFHSIGYAKPLGYGKVKVDSVVKGLEYSADEYIKGFELMMRNYNQDWDIIELLSMANENSSPSIIQEYLNLTEFQPLKDSGGFLQKYSLVSKNKTTIDLKNNQVDMKLYMEEKEKKEQEIEKKRLEEQNRIDEENKRKQEEDDRPFNELIKEADTLFSQQNWQQAKEKYADAIVIKPNEDYPKQQKNKCDKDLAKGDLSLDALSEFNEFNSDSRKIIQDYFKMNVGSISDRDISFVKEFVFRCVGDLSGKKLKNFMKFNKDPWKFLKNIGIDVETTQNWYNEITKK